MPERYVGRSLGRFRVDSLIGSGGFAWVYRGYDPELEIPIALKVLKPQYAGDESFEARFRREASTAARLRHPNIIRILAVGREDDAVFFAMDYLPHGLVSRLQMTGTLPEQQILRVGLDIASALAFAHREGVIHRDIKTDNILFDEHGNAIVADFGIARATASASSQTGTNMVVGTPQYFSPEQARGQPLDGRSDLYSLGVTLYRAATGVLPFQGEDWYEIARQHIEEPPPRPRSFNPLLSRSVEQVILTCLAKDPAQRYPTAEALHVALGALLAAAGDESGEQTVAMGAAPAGELPTSPTSGAEVAAPMEGALATPGGPPWLRRSIVAGVAAAVLAAMIALMIGNGGEQPASGPAVVAAALPPGDSVGSAGTTPARDLDSSATGMQADSIASPPPPAAIPPPVLVITAPPSAVVTVDGAEVGRGTVRREAIAPGAHLVSASVASPGECATARRSERVTVAGSGITRLRLSPRGCGQLSFDIRPDGARYVLTPDDGSAPVQGRFPISEPLVLPAGRYGVRIAAQGCYDFESDVRIAEGATQTQRIRLLCP